MVTVTLARVSTGHFDFIAVGTDDADALAALTTAWARHCAQYPDADPDLLMEIRDDINLTTIHVGGTLRDGEEI